MRKILMGTAGEGGLLKTLWQLVQPREASAEVIPGDPTAGKLIERMKTGPLPPAWREIFEAAEAQPEQVRVFAEPRTLPAVKAPTFWEGARRGEIPALPVWKALGYYWPGWRQIDVHPTRVPDSPSRARLDVEGLFSRELAHFLTDILRVRPPRGFTEHQLIDATMLAPEHPPLLPEHAPYPPWHPRHQDLPPRGPEASGPWHPPGPSAQAATQGWWDLLLRLVGTRSGGR